MKRVLVADGSGDYSFSIGRALSYCKDYELHFLIQSTDKPIKLKYVCYHTTDSYSDTDKWIESIESVVKRQNIDLVIAGSEKAVEFLILHKARLATFTRLPELPDIEQFNIAKNKVKLSELMSAHGLSQPDTFIYRDNADTNELSSLNFPVLLKLPEGVGGAGIKKFSDEGLLQEYLTSTRFDENILCQNFITGRDICISVICKNGEIVAYTIQQAIIENTKLYAPSLAVEFVENGKVLQQACALMKALNWQGVAHIDMRLNENTGEVYVIEINPRFWDSLMASLGAGVNFPWLYCQLMLDQKVEFKGFRHIQYIRTKILLSYLLGKYRLLTPLRLSAIRTGLSFHLYFLRRFFSIRN